MTLTIKLQSICQGLVHPADLRGHGAIDGPVTNLNDKAPHNIRVNLPGDDQPRIDRPDLRITHLWDDFQLFALAVFGFRNGCFEALDDLAVKFLCFVEKSAYGVRRAADRCQESGRYRSAGDGQIHLPPVCTHQRRELFADALQYPEPVVLGQSSQKILHGIPLVDATHVLLQFLHDLRLVSRRETGSPEDDGKLRVFLEHIGQGGQRFGSAVERQSFGGGRILRHHRRQTKNDASERMLTISSLPEWSQLHTSALAYVPSRPNKAMGGLESTVVAA